MHARRVHVIPCFLISSHCQLFSFCKPVELMLTITFSFYFYFIFKFIFNIIFKIYFFIIMIVPDLQSSCSSEVLSQLSWLHLIHMHLLMIGIYNATSSITISCYSSKLIAPLVFLCTFKSLPNQPHY